MGVNFFAAGTISVILPSLIAKVGGKQYFGMVFAISTVASVIFAPIAGKLGDLYDKKTLFIAGSVVGSAGQIATAFMPSMPGVLVMRFIAGAGGAFSIVLGLTLIGLLFPPEQRILWLSYYGALTAMCNIIAPVAGGFFTDTIGWEWVFYLTGAAGLFGVLLVGAKLPKIRTPRSGSKFDWAGTALFAVLMLSVIALCQYGGMLFPWRSMATLVSVVFILCVLCLFVYVEKIKGKEAMMPTYLFQYRIYTFSLIAISMLIIASLSIYMFLPLLLQQVFGKTALFSALPITVQSIVAFALSPVFGKFIAKTGKIRQSAIVSAVVISLANLFYFIQSTAHSLFGMWVVQVLYGTGSIIAITVFHMAVQTRMPPDTLGIATAGIQTGEGIGAAVGVAVFSAISLTNADMSVSLPYVFLVACVFAAASLPFVLALGGSPVTKEKTTDG